MPWPEVVHQFVQDDKMIDEKLARQRAHERNIARYRRLLHTRLTDIERRFLERRVAEERTALSMLAVATNDDQQCSSLASQPIQ